MSIMQIQLLLAFLGYSPGEMDGLWGAKTKSAVTQFQKDYGLLADGTPGKDTQKALRGAIAGTMDKAQDTGQEATSRPGTGTFWDSIRYFTRAEFACTCGKYCNGYPVEPDELEVRICDEIRHRAGVPISIIDNGGSGIRCPKHNQEVGGVYNSEHLYGRAADLHPHGISPEQLKEIAEQVLAEMCPGMGGVGIYNWGCHVDRGKYSRWDERK